MRYVARQPIFDMLGHVHGYELLFRNAPGAAGRGDPAPEPECLSGGEADLAARTMLDNTVMFGLEWLTNGLPAFVSCSVEVLTEDLALVLPPERTVLGIPGGADWSPRLWTACRKLKAKGFRLALDDFQVESDSRPAAQVANYLRLDINRFGAAERRYFRSPECAAVTLAARNVESQENYSLARGEGFTLFQGDYFCHPVLLRKRKLPANRLSHFEIVRLLCHDPMDLRRVSQLVQRDASLTFRLLRLVNSPAYAMHQEVRSIESAMVIVGEETFRRIVSLAILSEINGEEPPEMLHMALLRAKFCELSAGPCGLDAGEQYLLGMFSLAAAILRLPMEELTALLPFRDAICEALLGTGNRERSLLSWLECHERGDWDACDRVAASVGASQDALMRSYAESAVWAMSALQCRK